MGGFFLFWTFIIMSSIERQLNSQLKDLHKTLDEFMKHNDIKNYLYTLKHVNPGKYRKVKDSLIRKGVIKPSMKYSVSSALRNTINLSRKGGKRRTKKNRTRKHR